MKGEKIMSVTLPRGLIQDIKKAVDEDGTFLSISDALRYGVRLALLLAHGSSNLSQIAKESRKQVITDHYKNV